MYASFKFELSIHIISVYAEYYLLKTPDLAWAFFDKLNLVTMVLCPSGIHPIEVKCEKACLVTTRCGTNFDNDITILIRIPWEQGSFKGGVVCSRLFLQFGYL